MIDSTIYRKLRNRLENSVSILPDKPEETIDSTLKALWSTAQGKPCSAAAITTIEICELTQDQEGILRSLVEQRVNGVPLAHLTERQCFMGIEMLAGPDALVPRQETEILGTAAVNLAKQLVNGSGSVTVVDVCTGSGNIALSIAHMVSIARVYGADLSIEAVELARRNANYLGMSSQVEFRDGDLLTPFDSRDFHGKVDLLTCNPPYINSAKVETMPSEISEFEPSLAFDGGPFGVAILMRLLQDAPRFLRAGGWLAFEVGLGQGPAMIKRMQRMIDFKEIQAVEDQGGFVRAILARC